VSTFHHELAAAIGQATGAPFTVARAQAGQGGDISQTFRLDGGPRSFFVKCQPPAGLAMFEAEAAGLAELAAADTVRVPRVICYGMAAGQAYLVLEYLPLRAQGEAARLGRQLALLHRVAAPRFGWTRANWIGATPQPNAWHDDWPASGARNGSRFSYAARPKTVMAARCNGMAKSCSPISTRSSAATRRSPRCCTVTCGAGTMAFLPTAPPCCSIRPYISATANATWR